jgi:hypothetical protein
VARAASPPVIAMALLAIALALVFLPLAPDSASSPFGCVFGRDLLTRYDQGGNIRYFNDRGPDCTNVALVAGRVGLLLLTGGAGVWLLVRARG